jgi:hypothetical protein
MAVGVTTRPTTVPGLSLHPVAFMREFGRAIGGALDGLVIGLTVGFIALTALDAPAKYLGPLDPVAVVLLGGATILFALLGAAVFTGVARACLAGGRWLDRRLDRAPVAIRGTVAIPFRVLASVPIGWLGALAVVVWLGAVGHTIGPLGLLVPAGTVSSYIYAVGLIGATLGLARAIVHPGLDRPIRLGRRVAAGAALALAVLLAASTVVTWVDPGSTASLVRPVAALDGIAPPTTLEDPGEPGPHAVRTLSDGSGTDGRRPAFGEEATLKTPTVDASRLLRPLGSGADEARSLFWGFGREALPVNGLVWLPEGSGPFPLVLIVHGNHAMGDFSEPGYAYLGTHLASRGFVAVSVDEDFLNGSWAGDWHGDEQIVRAWLLLLHIDQWRTWNADPASPVHGLVDLDRVALIGHSRGGEAASIAASIAPLDVAPRGGLQPWPTGLRIRSVISIAPSDGQYGSTVVLRGVDLLELAGGYDSDARGWSGLRQYARTVVTDDGFKAAFWSYRSNHGQFNTVWGRSDHGPAGGALLALAPILDPADQRDVARTAIGAFLEASLNGRDGYRGLFQRPMTGREWLPDGDIYLVRSTDARFEPLTQGDPSTPADGILTVTERLDARRSSALPLRALQPDQGTRGLWIGWASGSGDAIWGLTDVDRHEAATDAVELRFALANGTEPTRGAPSAEPLDPPVELTTTDGVTVQLPLSRWGALPPPLTVDLTKDSPLTALAAIDLSVRSRVERVLQSYAIPLSDFEAADPAFRADRLATIRLRLDRSTAGALWIADVGLAAPGVAP